MGSLEAGWLAGELDAVDEKMQRWSDGLKESFDSLFANKNEPSRLIQTSPGNKADRRQSEAEA